MYYFLYIVNRFKFVNFIKVEYPLGIYNENKNQNILQYDA